MTRTLSIAGLAFSAGALLLACDEATLGTPADGGVGWGDAAVEDAGRSLESDAGRAPEVDGGRLDDGGRGDGPADSGFAGPVDAGFPSDLGAGDGQDVITIGDSWMNLITAGIQQSLTRASGQPYRTYGVPGTRLLDQVIPWQYYGARDEDPDIKTVVMTGGGNDILLDPLVIVDCVLLGPRCKGVIDQVGARYRDLLDEFAAHGVEDVIIINYSRGTPLGPAAIDYSWETLGPICADAPVDCHMVDPDVLAGGRIPLRDGIHPTNWGYDLIAAHLVERMEREGMRR